ncbi:MAG: hypothetical protein ACD_84C00038G0009 [uncultured bacterium]|nr:MAG: hypothetical protein ACD_84C00038G0009 [uncultured bacterium]
MSKRSKHQAANALTKNIIRNRSWVSSQWKLGIERDSARRVAYRTLKDRKFRKQTSNFKGKFVKLRAFRIHDNGSYTSTFYKAPVVNGGVELLSFDIMYGLPNQTYKEVCGSY